MRKGFIMWIMLFVFASILVGCSAGSEKVSKVSIYKMENFDDVKEDSLVTFTEENAIKQFKKAFKSAKKQPGIADIADPEYKVILGGKSYFLWLSSEDGTIMYVNDTHAIYTLSDDAVKFINELLS
jgi:hypothetical protein